jgi:hypothetical protein
MNHPDPILSLEHTHGHLNHLAIRIGEELAARSGRVVPLSEAQRDEVVTLLEALRDELLVHFADEEEALFPFVRRWMPGSAARVDRLEANHDAICGAVVRLAHLASHDSGLQLVALYERFQRVYALHASEEAELLGELGRGLGPPERAELGSLLRALALG